MCSSQDGVGTQGNKCPFPQMDDAKKTHTQFKLDVTHKLGSHPRFCIKLDQLPVLSARPSELDCYKDSMSQGWVVI